MSTGSGSEEEVVEVSSEDEIGEEVVEMEKVKKENGDVKNEEMGELEEPLVRIVVTQRAKVQDYEDNFYIGLIFQSRGNFILIIRK